MIEAISSSSVEKIGVGEAVPLLCSVSAVVGRYYQSGTQDVAFSSVLSLPPNAGGCKQHAFLPLHSR